jgi:hypothetical protein
MSRRLSPLRALKDQGVSVSFEAVADPYSYSAVPDARRQARHVRYAEHLQVLLANLRGVEAATDFLHPDNAQRLVEVRMGLSKERWEILPHVGRAPPTRRLAVDGGDAAAAMRDGERQRRDVPGYCELTSVEEAIGAVAKAQELLEPLIGDPIQGKLPAQALVSAQTCLTDACALLVRADPDRPLYPDEWLELLQGRRLENCPVERSRTELT